MSGRALFDVRPGEGRSAFRAFLALLGVTTAHTLIETARDALFLARIPAARLPFLYLTIAAIGILTTRASLALAGRAKGRSGDAVAASMIGAAVVTGLFWVAAASPSDAVLYGLFIFSGMFAGWVAGQLWLRFGALFTVQQAKRLYGAIGTGAVLGAVLGAAGARAALTVLPVRHLLLGASVVLVLTAAGPARVGPAPAVVPAVRRRDEDDAAPRRLGEEVAGVTRHPYLSRLLALTLLAAAVSTAIDYLFKREIAESVEPAKLGAFIATVSLATNIASLFAQAVGVGLAVRWLGVHRTLYIVPFLLAIGAGATVAGGALYAVLALRGTDGALRYSLHKTTVELLFVPLPDALRSRAKPILELVGQRGGQALASFAILGLGLLLAPKPAALAVALAVLVATMAWLVLAHGIRPRYLDVFRDTLSKGRGSLGDVLPDLDLQALETLIAALSSRRDAEVLGALDLLAAQRRARLVPSLILYHPVKAIVLRGLEILVEEGRTDFVDIAQRLLEHSDAEVRAAALRALATVQPEAEVLRECLASPREELRATAFVALAATGALDPTEAEGPLSSASEKTPESKRALALALANVDVAAVSGNDVAGTLGALASRLVLDEDAETRRLAARAMGAIGSPSFAPVLLDLLADRSAGLAAMEALATMGETAVRLLAETLERAGTTAELRWRVVGALARSTARGALPILVRHVKSTEDPALRSRILRALRSKQSSGVTLPIGQEDLVKLATDSVGRVGGALAFRLAHAHLLSGREETLGKTAGAELLQRLLRDREVEAGDVLFAVLALLHPTEGFPRIQRGFDSADAKARASARELVENLLRGALRDAVMPLVDDIDDPARLERIGVPRPETTYEALVEAMVGEKGELGAIALYHATELGLRSAHDVLATLDAEGAALARDLSVPDLEAPA